MKLARAASIEDLRRMAARRIPGFVFTNIDEGAGDDGGLVRNRRAFEERTFRIRRLRPLGTDTGVEVFGRTFSLPFGASPVGSASTSCITPAGSYRWQPPDRWLWRFTTLNRSTFPRTSPRSNVGTCV